MTKGTKHATIPSVRKACIFCGAQGRKITKEHVVPKWIGELPSQHPGDLSTFINRNVLNDGFRIELPADPNNPSPLANRVCDPCNTRWMSDMETPAKKACVMLLKHGNGTEPVKLLDAERALLGLWATKTAIMFDYTPLGRSRRWLPEDARNLYATRTPPDFVRVWLAQLAGDHPRFRMTRPHHQRTPDGVNPTRSYEDINYCQTYFNFNDLVFIVEADKSGLPLVQHEPVEGRIQLWPLDDDGGRYATEWPLDNRVVERFFDTDNFPSSGCVTWRSAD
jgi:hypothetical protein